MISAGNRVIVAGGGFRAGILALLLDELLPRSEIMLVAGNALTDGSRQLPVLSSSIPRRYSEIFEPLIVMSWPAFRFEGRTRTETFDAQTVLLATEQLHIELLHRIGADRMRLSSPIVSVGNRSIELASGEVLTAREIVDVRERPGSRNGDRRGPTYTLAVRDISTDADQGICHPILFRELPPSDNGVSFGQYLPLSPKLVREMIYRPTPGSEDPGSIAVRGIETGEVVRKAELTLDARTLFPDPAGAGYSANSLDFGALLGANLNDLADLATQIAARQIRIVA